MKTVKAIYPNGLNDRSREFNKNCSPPTTTTFIPGAALWSSTSGNHVNLPSFNDVESIFKVIHNFGNNLKNAFYNIRKLLNRKEKKILNLLATEILNKGNFFKLENREMEFYNFVVKILDAQLYKPKQLKRKKCFKTNVPSILTKEL